MPALEAVCEERLARVRDEHLQRELVEVERLGNAMIRVEGRDYVSFSCNDYFGLSTHPEVIAAGHAAKTAGAGASRLVTGNHPAYAPLEAKLAQMKQKQAALVFGSGYLANLGAISSLVGKDDLIIADKLIHACMIDGAQLSGAKLMRFAHNDMAHAAELLSKHRGQYRHCLLLSETVFSMDGDLAPMEELRTLADVHDAWLLVDDAHGIGLPHVKADLADIIVGTFSKAVGCYGGYIAASEQAKNLILQNGRSFIFSTGLPESIILQIIKSLELMSANNYAERMLNNVRYFGEIMGAQIRKSPIQPYMIGEAERALNLQAKLKAHGLWVSAIRPPTVPPKTSRLRIAFSALHTPEHIEQLAEAITSHG